MDPVSMKETVPKLMLPLISEVFLPKELAPPSTEMRMLASKSAPVSIEEISAWEEEALENRTNPDSVKKEMVKKSFCICGNVKNILKYSFIINLVAGTRKGKHQND